MNRLIPDTLAARTLLVLVLGLALSHSISVALYFTDRTNAEMLDGGEHISERIATIDRLIRNSPQAERQRLIELANDARLHVTRTPQSAIPDQPQNDWYSGPLRDALIDHLSPDGKQTVRLQHMGMTATQLLHARAAPKTAGQDTVDTMMVSLPLPDQSWLNFAVPVMPPKPFWTLRFGLSLAVMLLAVAILSALVVHNLTKPLAVFAAAAQRLGVDVNAPPLPEGGPSEVRQATRAFNEMQDRIRRFVEDRTQMIAAISHDLGTPITRMRLRAEFVDDQEQQNKMLADLDDMEKMVFSALAFARDEAAHEPGAAVDLATLLQRVCDNARDTGMAVDLNIGEATVPFHCRPVALRRAIGNLVDNAVKYGGRARVSLANEANAIVVIIDDDGPGIAVARREDVFKPFHRLEASRSRETGGTGLGLTVARTIIRAHGGDIALSNRAEGGLRVEIKLPV
ncbi:MAG: ATP-binding protein [Hyphomicrobiales bacterium]